MPRNRDLPQTDDLLPWDQAEAVLKAAETSRTPTRLRELAWMSVQRRLSLSTGQVSALRVDSYDRKTRTLAVQGLHGRDERRRDASSVAEVLERWLDERNTARLYSTKRDDPMLFIGRQGPLVDRTLRGLFKDYTKAAGLGTKVHPNALRQPVPSDNPGFHLSMFTSTEAVPQIGAIWSPKPLQPFRPKADTEYEVEIVGGTKVRSPRHETLVNDFARWLKVVHGYEPQRNNLIDLALIEPPVVVEAKYVEDPEDWPNSIRQAVGQLYEYRFFGLVAPKCPLLFLASNRVADRWLRYLEDDRRIAVCWRNMDGFELTGMARTILQIGDGDS